MAMVTGHQSVWRDVTMAWRACMVRLDDTSDPVSERHEASLLRQYLASVVILGTTLTVCVAAVLGGRPSPASSTMVIVASSLLAYLLFLTELSAVPQMLRSIPELQSRRLRRMRSVTALIGVVETMLPACFVLVVMLAR